MSTVLIHELDQLLAQYYIYKNSNGHLSEHKTGDKTSKLLHFFQNEPYFDNDDKVRRAMNYKNEADYLCERLSFSFYSDFPCFIPTDGWGSQRHQFAVLFQYLYYHRVIPSDSELIKSFIEKYNRKVIYELDGLFKEYYSTKNKLEWWYYEWGEGIGIFRAICEQRGFNDDILKQKTDDDPEELCRKFHEELSFPCFEQLPPADMDHREYELLQFMHFLLYLHKFRAVPSDRVLQTSFFIKYKCFSWSHIAESMKHQMSNEMCSRMLRAIGDDEDIEEEKERALKQAETKRKGDVFLNSHQIERRKKEIEHRLSFRTSFKQEAIKEFIKWMHRDGTSRLGVKEIVFIHNAVRRAKKVKSAKIQSSDS